MIASIFKDKRFDLFFSIMMGLFLATLLRPMCKDGNCFGYKAPPVKELTENYYKIKEKCYRFHPVELDCPTNGVIEPFRR